MAGAKDSAERETLALPEFGGGRGRVPHHPAGYQGRSPSWSQAQRHLPRGCREKDMPGDTLQQRVGPLNPESRGTPSIQTFANRKSQQPDYELYSSGTFSLLF